MRIAVSKTKQPNPFNQLLSLTTMFSYTPALCCHLMKLSNFPQLLDLTSLLHLRHGPQSSARPQRQTSHNEYTRTARTQTCRHH